ncbi:MAG: hypothetical protein ACXVBJ_10465 [Flavisolibacter sp.]
MKRLIMLLVFLGVLTIANGVQAQEHRNEHRFYYYPKSNVYYDPVNRQYIYSNDNNNWTTVQRLPSNVAVQNSPRVILYSNSPEVWQMNAQHREKYRNYNSDYERGKGKNRMQGNEDRDRDRDRGRDRDRDRNR